MVPKNLGRALPPSFRQNPKEQQLFFRETFPDPVHCFITSERTVEPTGSSFVFQLENFAHFVYTTSNCDGCDK